MNDPQHELPSGCLSSETLRRIADGNLPASTEEAVIAHLNDCAACQHRLEAIDEDLVAAGQLRGLYARLSAAGLESSRAEQAAALPGWEDCGDCVELMPGLRLSPPRSAPFVARLGRFDVAGILGRGGMGFVLDAYDPELQRPVALKIMKPELGRDTLAADRFLQEARSAARLQHPNVVSIYEVSTNTDPRFIVMELVRGKSLASIIDCESPLRPVRAARITLEILAALAHAHAEGIIHRDVKPGNILLDARVQTAKLTDFGLARGVDDALRHTAAGCVVGTPWYIAPEQATGQYRLDGRCDLFSTGVVLFEMLTGALPFPGRDPREVMQRICHEPAPDPRTLEPSLPDLLVQGVNKSLQTNPQDRYPTAAAFARDLHTFLTQHQTAAEESTELWLAHTTCDNRDAITELLSLTQPQPPFHGRVWISRCAVGLARDILTVTRDNRDCCRIGEKFTLQVQADVDCCVTLLDVGSSGNLSLLLLNHRVAGGQVAKLSGPDDDHEWVVGGPAGVERIKAIFTRQPLAIAAAQALSPLAASGRSRDIVTRIKQVGRTLQQMPPDSWTDATCQFLVERS